MLQLYKNDFAWPHTVLQRKKELSEKKEPSENKKKNHLKKIVQKNITFNNTIET